MLKEPDEVQAQREVRNSVKTQNQGLTSLICNTICLIRNIISGNEMRLLIFFSETRDYRQEKGTYKLKVKL